jgi:nickel-dependent lactate racemase
MGTFRIPYGNSSLTAELPERTRVLKNTNKPLPALPDPAQAIRDALNSPLAHDPLTKLVNSKSKVTIAFDDPIGFLPAEVKPGFIEVAIKVLLEELDKLGVDRHNIRLVCAVGLHRMWTQSELAEILGDDLVSRASPSWLFNFDAEDQENLVFLGETKRHHEVEVSRLVTDSDQLIYVSHPWSHFNGSWKTVVVGLGSWRSIRHHHRPFAKASGKSSLDPKRSAFPKLLNEMGAVIEAELAKKGRRVLVIEGNMNNASPQELVQVAAGSPVEAHEQGIPIVQKQQVIDIKGQSDVVIYGIGNRRDPYSKGIKNPHTGEPLINPIQVRNVALSYSYGLFQNVPLVKPGGIVIFCHPCPNDFHLVHNPSYAEMFDELLPHMKDPVELWELYAEEYAHRPEFVHKYRYGYAFHGTHPLILYGQGLYGLNYVGKAFLAGATDFEVARRLSFEPFASVEDAVAEAEKLMGKDCSITYLDMPQSFVCNVEP